MFFTLLRDGAVTRIRTEDLRITSALLYQLSYDGLFSESERYSIKYFLKRKCYFHFF